MTPYVLFLFSVIGVAAFGLSGGTHVHRDQANGVLAGAGAARQGALSHRARVALADRHPAEECEGSAQGKGCTRSGEVAPAVNRHDVEERLHSCALGTRAKVIAVECTPCNRRGRSRGHSSRQASSPVIASQRRCCTEPAKGAATGVKCAVGHNVLLNGSRNAIARGLNTPAAAGDGAMSSTYLMQKPNI